MALVVSAPESGNISLSDAGDRTFRLWEVNTMPADALAPKVARALAGTVLAV